MGLGSLQINTKFIVFWGIIKHIFVHRELQFGKSLGTDFKVETCSALEV